MSYTTATVLANLQDDGASILRVRFTGDAGEPPVDRNLTISGTATLQTLRGWAIGIKDDLNGARSLARARRLAVGQTVNLAAITPPAATAKEAWFSDWRRLERVQRAIASGVAPATADDSLQASLLSRFGSIPLTEADF